jgi:hypothetical protein
MNLIERAKTGQKCQGSLEFFLEVFGLGSRRSHFKPLTPNLDALGIKSSFNQRTGHSSSSPAINFQGELYHQFAGATVPFWAKQVISPVIAS